MTLWTAVVMAVVGATVPSAFAVCVILLLRALAKEQPSSGRRPGVLLSLMISACAGCAVWWIWLSWGGYYEDIYGQPQGPYRPWQVIACGITMVVLSIVMGLWSRWRYSGPFLVALGASWGFSVAWGIDAFAEDELSLIHI